MTRQTLHTRYASGVAKYLANADGIKVDGSTPHGRQWRQWLDELVAEGLMRRSSRGTYWWL